MLEQRLEAQIARVAQRLRWLAVLRTLCWVWVGALFVVAGLWLAGPETAAIDVRTSLLVSGVPLIISLLVVGYQLAGDMDQVDAAREIERCYPELNARLLAAVSQRRDVASPRLGYLQATVIGETLAHRNRTGWSLVAPRSRFVVAGLLQGLLLSGFGILLVLTTGKSLASSEPGSERSLIAAAEQYTATIEPGNVEIERGTSLLVLARFERDLPAEVQLAFQTTTAEPQKRAMSKSLDDPVYAARLAEVQSDLTYAVEYAGVRSSSYRVTVFDYPELERADVQLTFPEYTSQPATLVEDIRQITAVEGTKLKFIARLNKDVATARLVHDDGPAIELKPAADEPQVYAATWPLTATARYRLELIDPQGRKNKQPPEFTFTAVPNRKPDIKLVFPARDVQVSPLEEIELQARIWDDFSLVAYGIAYSLDGQPPQETVLGEHTAARQKLEARQLISFEALEAQPDQLLSYHFFADDVGPGGQKRRTLSDMFFCEVRPFDEIYRQGEQSPGKSEGEAASDADKLVDLQKQVIAATWTVIRRETAPQPGTDFPRDAAELVAGQQAALALADELEAKLRSPESQAFLEAARVQMRSASKHLELAIADSAAAPLTPALAAEQAAYQALLKLRAREHTVTRGAKSSGKGSSSSKRSQEQLSQLELKNTENRYEEQRTADPQEDAAERETRQVLNRLRELAQRQEDLNERIKELQASLEAADTEQQREEIRKQLKRLRDEEQQILRDADELRDRMDQPANQQRMAEAKQQLDKTRANVRQASEALEAGQAAQAAAVGTRAQQQFQELRDDFRKLASGRFNDDVRQMREAAQQLARREQALGEQLAEQGAKKSLRELSGRDELQAGFEQQRTDLERLTEQMRKTVEEAETTEPLLSKHLYDAIRQTRQQRPGEALEMTRQLLERGFVDQSRQAEELARSGIEQLKSGVERAAEDVLGDETEALRRARDTVDALARAVDAELARATGQGEPADKRGDDTTGSDGKSPAEPNGKSGAASPDAKSAPSAKSGGDKSAEESDAEPSPGRKPGKGSGSQTPTDAQQPGGDQKPGEAQPGEGQPGERQPGEGQGGQRGGRPGGGERGGAAELLDAVAGGRSGPQSGPLTGGDFRTWADRLRDVEEMLDDPNLRAEAARIRDRAGAMRAEFKRHSREPNWELVRSTVSRPLAELRQRLAEELLKRQSKDALVPLDRDQVPARFADPVRRYYERLGSGQ